MSSCPAAMPADPFFDAWQRGVRLFHPRLFGPPGQTPAREPWHLCPNLALIDEAIDAMSGGQRKLLAVMVSVYNPAAAAGLLQRAGICGFADLGELDAERRQIIADLITHYRGW